MNLDVARILVTILEFYGWLILAYVILSWVAQGSSGTLYDIYRALGNIVEPYLGIFRRIIPPIGMVDISPIVAFFVLRLIESLVSRLAVVL